MTNLTCFKKSIFGWWDVFDVFCLHDLLEAYRGRGLLSVLMRRAMMLRLHFGVRHPQHREEDDTSASTTTTDLFESKSAVTCTGRVLRNLQHGSVLSKGLAVAGRGYHVQCLPLTYRI